MVTPVTPPERLRRIGAASRGFTYAVTVTGTTGGPAAARDGLASYLDRARAASGVPLLAGFGIRDARQVAALAGHADGFIVGSALIEEIEAGRDPAAFLAALRAGAAPSPGERRERA
jgi:tryptophan synthase alpha chain